MKTKFTRLLVMLGLPCLTIAQSGLTNLSFESWSTTLFGPSPTGWFGSNLTKQTTGAQNGSNYVRITNANQSTGVMMLGTPGSFTMLTGGEPFTQIPTSLNGFYKASGLIANYPGEVFSYTSKNGSMTAVASKSISTNKSSWTSFSIPYLTMGSQADSIRIFVANPDTPAVAIIDVDNFSFAGFVVGLDQRSIGTSFLVYPNPAVDQLTIISKDDDAVSVVITDVNGRIVDQVKLEGERTHIDLRNYSPAVYFYSIHHTDGSTVLNGKFVVASR